MTAGILRELTESDVARWSSALLVVAGGFEDRASAFLERLVSGRGRLGYVCILDYGNVELNSSKHAEILRLAEAVASNVELVPLHRLGEIPVIADASGADSIIVDISAMSHVLMFEVLDALKDCPLVVDLVYFEAREYRPGKEFYDRLTKGGALDSAHAFARYVQLSDDESLYSRDCLLVQKAEFSGAMEPSKPVLLVAFLPFRRARLQLVLQELDVEERYFVLGEPVRADLSWRGQLLEVENFDALQGAEVVRIPTLDWNATLSALLDGPGRVQVRGRHNVVLVPLGSKMQTVACFAFWLQHQDIAVVFSQPKAYYSEKYSSGAGAGYVVPDFYAALP